MRKSCVVLAPDMSNEAAPKAKRRGRPSMRTKRIRQNISVSPDIIKKAKKIAFDERLSLSTWIEQMICRKIEEEQP
jgi:predicted HicB family RNase H-like nuclease